RPFAARLRVHLRVMLAAAALVAVALIIALWVLPARRSTPERPAGLEATALREAEEPDAPTGDSVVGPTVPVEAEGAGDSSALSTRQPEVSLPYSVLIASFSSYEDALERQRRWASRAGVPTYVAPTPIRGVIYYRVFAGLLPERRQAEELMTQLYRAGIKDTVRNWDIRPTGLTLSFGVYPSVREAESVQQTLLERGVPTYIVPAGDGEGLYHVYGGGYEAAEDARPIQDLFERSGLADVNAELVERVGLVSR
ncbi:MAG: SPOR domain-containing protein, partial [Gemmatimonadota bacterium]